jgi:hypothetical protein
MCQIMIYFEIFECMTCNILIKVIQTVPKPYLKNKNDKNGDEK